MVGSFLISPPDIDYLGKLRPSVSTAKGKVFILQLSFKLSKNGNSMIKKTIATDFFRMQLISKTQCYAVEKENTNYG